MNQEVTQYIENLSKKSNQGWQVNVCETLRRMVYETIPSVEERIQYGKPHYLKNGKYASVIHAGKDKVSFMIFHAEGLEEIKGFLRSMGKGERKTADIKEGQEVDYARLSKLLQEASAGL